MRRRVRKGKSSFPDCISRRTLKSCALQLSHVFSCIFNGLLQPLKVQSLWKLSIFVPVPKNKFPRLLSEYRPVAPTSLVMKSFKRIIKNELLNDVQANLDSLQFATGPAGEGV